MSMKTLALATPFALLALALLASPAAAEAKSFNVQGHVSDSGEFYFTFDGIEGRNPTVPLAAGDHVTITYKTVNNVHNFHVGAPVNLQTPVKGSDAAAETLTFTVPDSASTIEYWCDPHKGSGMKGEFTVAGATGGEKKESPGFGVALVVLGLAGAVLAVRRRA